MAPPSAKVRLDLLLHTRGLVSSRAQARGLILSGSVSVQGQTVDKAGSLVTQDAEIALRAVPAYVGRGGIKLKAALDHFHVPVEGRMALDVGASTGGFTDCLLQHGAAGVYAVDVGYGQMAWRLRQDPRVVVIERQNIRTLPEGVIPQRLDLVVVDVSFISLSQVMPHILPLLKETGEIITLVKPQFEVGYGEVERGGVIRSPEKRRMALDRLCAQAPVWGLWVVGWIPSPILGKKGNVEFLVYFRKRGEAGRIL